MKKKIAGLVLITLFVTNGCGIFTSVSFSDPKIIIDSTFASKGIAVLNFTRAGALLPHDISNLVPDKLTEALFSSGQFIVIDRSIVNSALKEFDIKNSEILNSSQIKKLGEVLKAEHLILGKIRSVTSNELFEDNKPKQIQLSFRIIKVQKAEITGFAEIYCTYKENPIENIDLMIENIIDAMVTKDD